MNKLKKIITKLLFPHYIIILLLIPLSIVMLVYSMVKLASNDLLSIISYIISAYTLAVTVLRIKDFINFIKIIKTDNRIIRKFTEDIHLRLNIILYGSLIWNCIYALFQFVLGITNKSFWFISMSIYYLLLGLMRLFIVKHTKLYKPREQYSKEVKKYLLCGWILLIMNVFVAIIVFFMVHWNRTFYHHEITTITIAAYTFATFTMAIINYVKYRKFHSPIYSATRLINIVAASVSIITLESTMLTSFGKDITPQFRQLMLALTGGAISIFVIVIAIIMIVNGYRQLKIKKEEF